MPSFAYSIARCWVTVSRPPLVIIGTAAGTPRIGLRASAAVIVTMLPPVFCANSCLMASCVTYRKPARFVATSAWKSSAVYSVNGLVKKMPALFTSASIDWKRDSAVSTILAAAAGSPMWPSTRATRSEAAISVDCVTVRELATTFQPRSTNAFTIPAPIPCDAPVTIAVLGGLLIVASLRNACPRNYRSAGFAAHRPLLFLPFDGRSHPPGLAHEVGRPLFAFRVETYLQRVPFQFVDAQHGGAFVFPFRDDCIDLGRLLGRVELIRPCLDYFAIPAHRPLVAGEGNRLLHQFVFRSGLAVHGLRDELPGSLNFLQDFLTISSSALQSPAHRERGEDHEP